MPLDKALTWSCLEAFSQDSSLVRNMREEYFKRHCPNFNTENTCDLSDIFWCMAETAELLGSTTYEIRQVWAGLDELWQANYTLRTLPKGLKFLRAVAPLESPKVMGLTCIHDPYTLCHFNGWPTALGVERRAKMRAQSSITSRWCIIGLALCARNVSAAPHLVGDHLLPQPEGLPTLRGGRPWWVILVGVTTSMRHTRSISPKWEPRWRTQGRFWHPLGQLIGDKPCLIGSALEENQMEEVPPTNPKHPITSVFPHPDQMATTFCKSRTA